MREVLPFKTSSCRCCFSIVFKYYWSAAFENSVMMHIHTCYGCVASFIYYPLIKVCWWSARERTGTGWNLSCFALSSGAATSFSWKNSFKVTGRLVLSTSLLHTSYKKSETVRLETKHCCEWQLYKQKHPRQCSAKSAWESHLANYLVNLKHSSLRV